MRNCFASAFALAGITAGVWFVPATTQAATPSSSASSDLSALSVPEPPHPSRSGELLAQYTTPTATVISNQRSLTVTGTGQSSVPADQAILQMFYYSVAPVEVTTDVSAVPVSAPIDVNDLQFIVNALTEMGVPASDITVYADPNSYGGARVQLKLAQPTTDRISQIITRTNEAVAEDARFSPSGTNVIYTIAQCAVPENEARQKAMADARTRAADLATIAEVELGEILTLSDYSTWNLSYSSFCPSSENLQSPVSQYGGYPFDPTTPPAVSVTSQVTATFAIED